MPQIPNPFRERPSDSPDGRHGNPSHSVPAIMVFVLAVAVILAAIVLLTSGDPQRARTLIDYLVQNPLLVAVVGAMFAGLLLNVVTDLFKRAGDLEARLHLTSQHYETMQKNAVEEARKALAGRWDAIETKLKQIVRDHPWLEAINDFDYSVNVPTAVAARRNVEIHLLREDRHLAYEVLYEASLSSEESKPKSVVNGAPTDFEELALLAYAIFDDIHLADRLLSRAGSAAGRNRAAWDARRIHLALLSHRFELVEELRGSVEASLKTELWRDILRRVGVMPPDLMTDGQLEALAALGLTYQYLSDRELTRRQRRIQAKLLDAPQWVHDLVGTSKRVINRDEDTGIAVLMSLQPIHRERPSVAATMFVAFKHAEDTAGIRNLSELLARRRPGLHLITTAIDRNNKSAGDSAAQPPASQNTPLSPPPPQPPMSTSDPPSGDTIDSMFPPRRPRDPPSS